jgi:DNA (cytosine-5)-methyltransferase 1
MIEPVDPSPQVGSQIEPREMLERLYAEAEKIHKSGDISSVANILGEELYEMTKRLGTLRHAARGVALALATYKCIAPEQDIRRHKADQEGGFSARSFDAAEVVPFLKQNSLPYNVETHWLSQTFSFAGPYERGIILKTVPKDAGPLLVEVINRVNEAKSPEVVANAVATVLLLCLVEERNKGKVSLEKPKELPIDQVIELLSAHILRYYAKNAPRLPQIAVYAVYRCIVGSMKRYEGLELRPLERLKTANRKSGTIGDIDVNRGLQPVEAVEVRLGVPVTREDVAEVIQKIKAASVERYLILSTAGIAEGELEEIKHLQATFKRANGCEIIVNGVLETIRYYLRLIRSTTDFLFEYTTLLESDPDVDYEHRLAWNEICAKTLG